ncbi:GNAT family N-acetyltransferase [Pelagibacterium luteolum]|uniref:GNAT family N-acetyltransferase n=1 Tax=Pelagibacterium luteolum TaxID=440168 RepID=UPI000B89E41A|nr:GNAT family N-acetyltransferase [Pelagibacterium luteolum]
MLSIGSLEPDDIPATVDLHRKNLRLGLFPKLGREFLGLYQRSFAQSPYGIALVARGDDGVIGALFATTSNAEHYRWVTRNMGMQMAMVGGTAMLTHPHAAITFARTRLGRYSRGLARHMGLTASSPSTGAVAPQLSVLSHIVTSDAARRRGIGRQLIETFKAKASARGVHKAVLVTEEGGLGTPFFERLGCRLVNSRQSQDGAVLREYKMILDEEGAYEDLDDNRNHRIVVRAYPNRLGAVHPSPLGAAAERS